MAFKMKSPLKQIAMPIGASGSLGIDQMQREQRSKIPSAEEIERRQAAREAKKKCDDNPNSDWINGKCVYKKIAENRTKTKTNTKSKPSTSSGNFA